MLAMLDKNGLQEFSSCGDDLARLMHQDIRRMSQVVRDARIEKQ